MKISQRCIISLAHLKIVTKGTHSRQNKILHHVTADAFILKDKSKVWGDFWHNLLNLKLAENDDVGKIVIWGL